MVKQRLRDTRIYLLESPTCPVTHGRITSPLARVGRAFREAAGVNAGFAPIHVRRFAAI
jgi:hypothetical protein